jgi:glycine/serine hydroxymethyltransferase
MILCDAAQADAVDRAVFPGLQGGPHDHTTAAIAVALHEAATPAFADYARAVVANAAALAEALLERGFELVSGGTDNHLILMDLTSKQITGKRAAQALDRAGLSPTTTRCRSIRANRSTRPESVSVRPPLPAAGWGRRTWLASPTGWTGA